MTPQLIPVIHYLDDDQARRNADLAFELGADGILLIEMNGQNHALARVADEIKTNWAHKLVGVNYLGKSALSGLKANLANKLDMTWTDQQLTHSSEFLTGFRETKKIRPQLKRNPAHKLFAAVAFKYQIHEPNPPASALKAIEMGFIPTTSGAATGIPADMEKIVGIRNGIGNGPLAIASGITPENVSLYDGLVTHFIVSTGISKDFHNFDEDKMKTIREKIDNFKSR